MILAQHNTVRKKKYICIPKATLILLSVFPKRWTELLKHKEQYLFHGKALPTLKLLGKHTRGYLDMGAHVVEIDHNGVRTMEIIRKHSHKVKRSF